MCGLQKHKERKIDLIELHKWVVQLLSMGLANEDVGSETTAALEKAADSLWEDLDSLNRQIEELGDP